MHTEYLLNTDRTTKEFTSEELPDQIQRAQRILEHTNYLLISYENVLPPKLLDKVIKKVNLVNILLLKEISNGRFSQRNLSEQTYRLEQSIDLIQGQITVLEESINRGSIEHTALLRLLFLLSFLLNACSPVIQPSHENYQENLPTNQVLKNEPTYTPSENERPIEVDITALREYIEEANQKAISNGIPERVPELEKLHPELDIFVCPTSDWQGAVDLFSTQYPYHLPYEDGRNFVAAVCQSEEYNFFVSFKRISEIVSEVKEDQETIELWYRNPEEIPQDLRVGGNFPEIISSFLTTLTSEFSDQEINVNMVSLGATIGVFYPKVEGVTYILRAPQVEPAEWVSKSEYRVSVVSVHAKKIETDLLHQYGRNRTQLANELGLTVNDLDNYLWNDRVRYLIRLQLYLSGSGEVTKENFSHFGERHPRDLGLSMPGVWQAIVAMRIAGEMAEKEFEGEPPIEPNPDAYYVFVQGDGVTGSLRDAEEAYEWLQLHNPEGKLILIVGHGIIDPVNAHGLASQMPISEVLGLFGNYNGQVKTVTIDDKGKVTGIYEVLDSNGNRLP